MPFAQSGNSGRDAVAAPAPAPSANDAPAANADAGKKDADPMIKGLAFVSMTHEGHDADAADTGSDAGDDAGDTTETTTPPAKKDDDAGEDKARPVDGSQAGSGSGAPDYVTDLQSQLMAMRAELAQTQELLRSGGKAPEQQPAAKPAKKAAIAMEYSDGEPDEFISRKELYEREQQLTALINQSFGTAYNGIIGSEKQRFYSDYEAARREHTAAVADVALPKLEVDEIWRQYEAAAVEHGFGKDWRSGFDTVIRNRSYDTRKTASDAEMAKKDAEIAKLKKQLEGQTATKRQTAARLTSGAGSFQQPNDDLKSGVVRSYKKLRSGVVRDMRRNG